MNGQRAGAPELTGLVQDLLATALRVSADGPTTAELQRAAARLESPLQVLVAGPQGQATAALVEALRAELARATSDADGDRWEVSDAGISSPDGLVVVLGHGRAGERLPLDAFQPDQTGGVAATATLGVVPRADDLLPGRPDGASVAARVAAAYRRDPVLQLLLADVLPVAPRLANAAGSLRSQDHDALRRLAAARLPAHLLTVDGLLSEADAVSGDPLAQRKRLVEQLGVGGLRLALTLVASGAAGDVTALRSELRTRSGMPALQSALAEGMSPLARALRAQAALQVVTATARRFPSGSAEALVGEAERLLAGAHAVKEVQLLEDLITGRVRLPAEEQQLAAVSLLGREGVDVRTRLRLRRDTPTLMVREAVAVELSRWQRLAEHPLSEAGVRRAAFVLRRTCEGLLAHA